jgi:hypothetical protein
MLIFIVALFGLLAMPFLLLLTPLLLWFMVPLAVILTVGGAVELVTMRRARPVTALPTSI